VFRRELPDALLDTGRDAFLDSKQLTFHQAFRESGAIKGYQGLSAPRRLGPPHSEPGSGKDDHDGGGDGWPFPTSHPLHGRAYHLASEVGIGEHAIGRNRSVDVLDLLITEVF